MAAGQGFRRLVVRAATPSPRAPTGTTALEARLIELEDVPELRDPVLIAAFEGWNDAGEAASVRGRAPGDGLGRRADRGARPRGLLRLPGQPAPGRAPTTGARRITWPTTRILRGDARPALDRDVVLVAGHRAVDPLAGLLASSCSSSPSGSASRPFVTLGALLADVPHTRPDPGHRRPPTHEDMVHRLRPRAEQVRGPDRHRRRARRRRAPGRAAVAVAAGRRSRTTSAARPRPRRRSALLRQLEELLDVTDRRSATCPRRPGRGSAASTSWPSPTSEVAEYVQSPRGGPGHRRPARGQRRRDRPGVRALPAPARRRARP